MLLIIIVAIVVVLLVALTINRGNGWYLVLAFGLIISVTFHTLFNVEHQNKRECIAKGGSWANDDDQLIVIPPPYKVTKVLGGSCTTAVKAG